MIKITAHMRIMVAVTPVDFRKGIDVLAAVCRQVLCSDPFSGTVFVFVNKARNALRLLIYDGQGFWLCHKRLSRGRFAWNFRCQNAHVTHLAAAQLQQPIVVVAQEKSYGTHYRLRAYPNDPRDQFLFITDLTVRGKAALMDLGVEFASLFFHR
jgi:transposase